MDIPRPDEDDTLIAMDPLDVVERVLALFPDLRPHLHRPAGYLSGGQRQMLAFAAAILRSPRVMLIDEFTQGLSPASVASIATLGIDPDFVEAMLFAWLAHERLAERAQENVYTVTGARGARVLGSVYFGF